MFADALHEAIVLVDPVECAMTAVIRTLIVTLAIASLLVAGFWHLTTNEARQAMEEVTRLNEQLQQNLEARQAMVQRLSRSHRLAHVQIEQQDLDEDGEVADTDLLFIELDDEGRELDRQAFTIPGAVLFVDAWSIKFNHEEVATGHPLLGRTIVLLRRIYSDQMAPRSGFPLDTPGAVPAGYAVSEVGRFEQQLWNQFWSIASDDALATSMGVRVAQGEAVYKRVSSGELYELTVDAAGGINLVPVTPLARAGDTETALTLVSD